MGARDRRSCNRSGLTFASEYTTIQNNLSNDFFPGMDQSNLFFRVIFSRSYATRHILPIKLCPFNGEMCVRKPSFPIFCDTLNIHCGGVASLWLTLTFGPDTVTESTAGTRQSQNTRLLSSKSQPNSQSECVDANGSTEYRFDLLCHKSI